MSMTAQIEQAHHEGRSAYRSGVSFDQLPPDENIQWGYRDEQRRLGFFVDGAVPVPKPARDALSVALAAMDKAYTQPVRDAEIGGPLTKAERIDVMQRWYFGRAEIEASTSADFLFNIRKTEMKLKTYRESRRSTTFSPDERALMRLLITERIGLADAQMAEQLGAALRHDANFGGVL